MVSKEPESSSPKYEARPKIATFFQEAEKCIAVSGRCGRAASSPSCGPGVIYLLIVDCLSHLFIYVTGDFSMILQIIMFIIIKLPSSL